MQLGDKPVEKLWKYRGKVDGVENLLWSSELIINSNVDEDL